jgi:hypothetical protein
MSNDASAILEELDRYYSRESWLPGDIDTEMLSRRYGISESGARRRMDDLAQKYPGQWKTLTVWQDGTRKKILRKVDQAAA